MYYNCYIKQLYSIHSPSDKEKEMRTFLEDWIKNNVPGATCILDGFINL